MNNSRWIHINEGVRVYNKTRQTFYNWINKGYLRSKKLHSKIYILTDDIEKLINEHISIENTETNTSSALVIEKEENDDETFAYDLLQSLDTREQKLLATMHLQKEQSMTAIKEVKHELRQDIQRSYEGMQQQFFLSIEQLEDKFGSVMSENSTQKKHITLMKKKINFWGGYIVFVLVNLLLLGYLLY